MLRVDENGQTTPPTVPPTALRPQDGWRTSEGGVADAYLGLKITRVIRVARLLVTISFFVQGPSLAFDHSRCVLCTYGCVYIYLK